MKKNEAQLELLFKALADRTRLRLLNLMSAGEVCVCFFVEVLGASQPKISRHLAYLRRAALRRGHRLARRGARDAERSRAHGEHLLRPAPARQTSRGPAPHRTLN